MCISRCKKSLSEAVVLMHLLINLIKYLLTRRICNDMMQIVIFVKNFNKLLKVIMSALFRRALGSLFIVAASNASAGVITQDGVVFTSTFTGNVLTLEIDAAGRTGGWAGATAIDALGIKTVGSFGSVTMRSSTGAARFSLYSLVSRCA